jgi:iron(III) transport system substrate-binding protein
MLVSATIRRALAAATLAVLAASPLAAAEEVNVYTTREPGLLQPLLEAFTKSTGIRVNAIFVKDGLVERVKAESTNSPADVLMTVDFGGLVDAVNQDVTQAVRSEALEAAVPPNLRDPNGHWYALSLRARLVYASKDRVPQTAFTYEELADPKWKGKICIRSGQHPYNTALIAAYIAHYGEAKAEAWLRGIKANLARKATGGDREVARDILAGICDIGVGNSYYVGLMRSGNGGPDQQKWGEAINPVLATFAGGGTHVNISGAAVAKHAPNRANALKFLEFLVSNAAQELYARVNFEYPVRNGAAVDPIIAHFGTLKPDTIDIVAIAKNRKAASLLVDKVAFDN